MVFDGRYIYTDNEDGDLRALNIHTHVSHELGIDLTFPTSFGEGRAGGVYVATLAIILGLMRAFAPTRTSPRPRLAPGE